MLIFNSTWGQPVSVKWNTNTLPIQVNGTIGNQTIAWEPDLQTGCTTPFKTPYPAASTSWSIGAQNPAGSPGGFYHGLFAEFFGHFQDGDWNDLSIQGQRGTSLATRNTVQQKSLGDATIIPLDLGVNCQLVFGLTAMPFQPGGKLLPAICMRGDSMNFPINNGGDSTFVVPIGYVPPSDGASDPFDLR
jgi:hypothetical protein